MKKNKLIVVRDSQEDFVYAELIVPEEMANDILLDIKDAANKVYDEVEDFEYDNLYDYISDKYDEYIEHTPYVVLVD